MPGADPAHCRHVALNGSRTECLGDGDDTTGLRGFADRRVRCGAEDAHLGGDIRDRKSLKISEP
ncbi:hypothetical protein SY2F82_73880 [Streptomyces sp. Y2F8-2]|nr:hypothetical protein SY2F82_73880 [Streptomyces sp. Y2F8-2]